MKVIGVSGSLRDDSNTLKYVRKILGTLEGEGISTELVSLRGREIKPCTGCYDCRETKGICTLKGDDFDEIFEKMKASEGIILGSPVYVSAVVPQLHCLLSRAAFVSHWAGKILTGKVGGPVAVAQRAGQNMAFAQLLLWFFFNGITVPGSIYWNVGVAGTGGAHDAENDVLGMQIVDAFARNMAGVMKKIFV